MADSCKVVPLTSAPPPAVASWVAARIRAIGLRAAAREIGVSREAALALAIGADVRPGTRALAASAYQRSREEA